MTPTWPRVDAPKISPADVAWQVLDAVEADQIEVLADERTRQVKASLSRDHELIYPAVQARWDTGHPVPPGRQASGADGSPS